MNLAPDKRRSAEKIDGMVCLLMAMARASLAPEGQNLDEYLDSPAIG